MNSLYLITEELDREIITNLSHSDLYQYQFISKSWFKNIQHIKILQLKLFDDIIQKRIGNEKNEVRKWIRMNLKDYQEHRNSPNRFFNLLALSVTSTLEKSSYHMSEVSRCAARELGIIVAEVRKDYPSSMEFHSESLASQGLHKEHKQEIVEKLVKLAQKFQDPFARFNLLEKLKETHFPNEAFKLLNQKGQVRECFQNTLAAFKKMLSGKTCYVIFSSKAFGDIENKEVRDFLHSRFLPDLESAGLKPVCSLWDLSHTDRVSEFQSRVLEADFACAIYSRELNEACAQQQNFNSAHQIKLAKSREVSLSTAGKNIFITIKNHNDAFDELLENFGSLTTLKMTLLEGSTEQECYSYYEKMIQLLSSMSGISPLEFIQGFFRQAQAVFDDQSEAQNSRRLNEAGSCDSHD